MNDLSIIIPALNEAKNIGILLQEIDSAARELGIRFEILVIDGGSTDETRETAAFASNSVRVLKQEKPGYGGALLQGFSSANAKFILTLDADLSHDPSFLKDFWDARTLGDMIIGSRYVAGGRATMPPFRKILSRILNSFFRFGLSLPFQDLSSGFRLYRSSLVKTIPLRSSDFDVLQEILIHIYMNGWQIREIPIHYKPRKSGRSNARLIRFGLAYIRFFGRYWSLRNSVYAADYEYRAFDSRIPLQRYWQRKRKSIIQELSKGRNLRLDAGCGSSRTLSPPGKSIGLDIRMSKLRYTRRFDQPLVNASAVSLPFHDRSFDCIICAGLIDSFDLDSKLFYELKRVLKLDGILIIGTPDYDRWIWRMIEKIYKRIIQGDSENTTRTKYSLQSIRGQMKKLGFRIDEVHYILASELIVRSYLTVP